ncbi:MAG: hypothetical protein EBZ48_10575 [Proteobacteria bacterium]|nr:hypothetical protein [Pseudomonadota bacterium]
MTLSKIDCSYHVLSASEGGATTFVMLNPMKSPGSLVAAGAAARRDNIGSQVACKLAIEHFLESVLAEFPTEIQAVTAPDDGEPTVRVLEAAFKRANSSVYSFGHKLAAGGRMGASMIAMVITARSVGAARAGEGAAYLLRQGELFPFFEEKHAKEAPEQLQEQLVGAHSLVSVELASVPLEPEDVLLLLSRTPNEVQQRRMAIVLKGLEREDQNAAQTVVRRVFDKGGPPEFAMLVRIGPEAIYLGEPM